MERVYCKHTQFVPTLYCVCVLRTYMIYLCTVYTLLAYVFAANLLQAEEVENRPPPLPKKREVTPPGAYTLAQHVL